MKNKRMFISVVLTFVLLITSFMPFVAEAATFSDVPTNSGKYPAINWAVENGFMNGAGRFEPNATVKEGALVETLSRVDEHYQQVQEADMRYLFYGEFNLPLKGYVNKSLRNTTDVTRGDFARVFAAFRGYDLTEKHAVQYLYTQGVTTGVTGKKTYKDYQPERVLTKGDLAVFLYRGQQSERLAVKGLQLAAVGRDDSKVTLPPGFDGNTTTELPPPDEQEGNDIVGSESSKGLVQEVRISKEELIANGVDRTMLEIKLQTCDLSQINEEKTHQFQVKSKFGAYAVDGEGKVTRNVYTDGDTIYAEIVAPQLTKSVRDTITFELVNNNDKAMSCFIGKKIEVPLRYVPKAEMRVTYDVWDPDQPEDDNTNVKPPAIITETSPEFFQDGLIDVYTIFEDYKFEIGQLAEFRDVLGEVKREYIHYGKNENADNNALGYENAILKFENYPIALWLFDRMLHERVYEGVRYPAEVHYSQVDPLRPTYTIQGIDDVIASQAEQINAVAAIVQLMGYLPAEDKVTLEHYDSIYSIWAIYENLGVKEKDVFLAYEKGKK
ncbi:MAG TPA: S-layer homology domain-containing protein, partial [Metalysinibacillus sp.]